MSTPKLGSMASAVLYFCGTTMLAAAILLIPFLYKTDPSPCECPPVQSDTLATGNQLGLPPPTTQLQASTDSSGSPNTPALTRTDSAASVDTAASPAPVAPVPVEVARPDAAGVPEQAKASPDQTKWTFDLGTAVKLDEAQLAMAQAIGETLKSQPKTRAVVTGVTSSELGPVRAKNAARFIRDEVAKVGISSKRMATESAEDSAVAGLIVTVELKLPE